MLEIKLITVGTLKEEYLRAAEAEYAKRLSAFCRFEAVSLKEARVPDDLRGVLAVVERAVSLLHIPSADRIVIAQPAAGALAERRERGQGGCDRQGRCARRFAAGSLSRHFL